MHRIQRFGSDQIDPWNPPKATLSISKKHVSKLVDELHERLNAVKTELFNPIHLSDDDIKLLVLRRTSIKNENTFNRALPFTVANLKPSVEDQIISEARSYSLKKEYQPSRFQYKFRRDVASLHFGMFGTRTDIHVESDTGLITEQRAQDVHSDGGQAVYLMRVGGAATEVVSEKARAKAFPGVEDLIRRACLRFSEQAEEAREELRKLNILVPIRLNSLVLIDGIKTLHCSSPIPVSGVYSSFYRGTCKYANSPQ